jgi:hypothetical protein
VRSMALSILTLSSDVLVALLFRLDAYRILLHMERLGADSADFIVTFFLKFDNYSLLKKLVISGCCGWEDAGSI